MNCRHSLPMLLALALSGCVTIPDSLQGDYLQEPLPNAVTEDHQDQRVRWGGLLVATPRVGDSENCMEIYALPLDEWYRPELRSPSAGRFLACHDGQLDPQEFLPGRDLTLVGTLDGFVEGQVGNDIHRFPVVDVGSAHVWPLPSRFQRGPQPEPQDGRGQARYGDRQRDREETRRAVKAINRSNR